MPDIGRWNGMDQLSDKFHNASPYAYVMNNPAMFFDPDGRDMAPWMQGMWDHSGSGTTNWSNISNGFQNDINNGSDLFGTVDYQGTFTYDMQQVILRGRGNVDNWNSNGNLAFNQATMFSGVMNGLGNFNTMINRTNLANAIKNSEVAQSIGKFENFLFMDVPLFFAGGGFGSAAFRGLAGGYARGALLRGGSDLATQIIFKNGEVDTKQLAINTFVGIGGKNYSQMAKVVGVNVGLNTINNFGTSVARDGLQGLQNDAGLNTIKIIPTILTGAMGSAGTNIMTGVVLPSIYGNGMDAFLNANIKN